MEQSIWVSLKTAQNITLAFIILVMAPITKANGNIIKSRASVFTSGKMVVSIVDNGSKTTSMGMASKLGQMDELIKDSFNTTRDMGMESPTYNQTITIISIKGSGKTAKNKESESINIKISN